MQAPSPALAHRPARPTVPALALAGSLLAAAACVLQPRWASEHAALLALAAAAPVLAAALLGQAARGGVALCLLAMAVVAGSDLALRAGAEADAGPDLVSAAKLALWLAGGLLLPALGAAGWARLRGSPALLALGLFFAWGLVGSVGSATPAYSAAAAAGGLGLVALALVMAERLSARTALLAWTAALAAVVGASLLRGVLDPAAALWAMDAGAHLRLAGWFASPNNLGRAAALLLLMAALAAATLRGAHGAAVLGVAAALALPALHLSESRGAVLALAAALAWWLLAPRPRVALAALALGMAALLLLSALPWWGDDLARAFSRSGRLDEILSLTGRTEIWGAVVSLIGQEPVFGHGFAASREVLPAAWQGPHGWTTTSAHNLWLQAALGGGLVGLALLLAGQLAWLRDALSRPRPAADTVVVFVLVLGLLEASATGPSINTMSFALAWALALGARRA